MNLSGNWISLYKYHGDELGHHEVVITEGADNQYKIQGKDEAGSTLCMLLAFDAVSNTLTGTWEEHTSLRGVYKGAVFRGAVQFILNSNSTEAKGKWVGFNKDKSRVNSGDWILKR